MVYVLTDFENQTYWVTYGATREEETTIIKHGSKSLKITTSTNMQVSNPGALEYVHDLSSYVGVSTGTPIKGYFSVWIYVTNSGPTDGTMKFRTNFSTDFNYVVYSFSGLTTGWNLVTIDATNVSSSNGTIDWTDINHIYISVTNGVSNVFYLDYWTVTEDKVLTLTDSLEIYSGYTSSKLLDSYSEIHNSAHESLGGFGGSISQAGGQSFNYNRDFVITSCKLFLEKAISDAITGSMYCKIYAHSGTYGISGIPTGSALATSDAFDVSTLTTSYALYEFTFSGANKILLNKNTNYFLVYTFNGGDKNQYIKVAVDGTSPTHDGNFADAVDGSTWTAYPDYDTCFYIYGEISENGAFKLVNKSKTETLTLIDVKLKTPFKYFSDDFTLTDVKLKTPFKYFSDDFTLTDTLPRPIYCKTLVDAMTIDEEWSYVWETASFKIYLNDSFFPRDLSKSFSSTRSFRDTFNESSVLTKFDSLRSLTEGFSLSDSKFKSMYKPFLENYLVSEDLDKSWVTTRSYSDAFTLSDSKTKLPEKVLNDHTHVTDNAYKLGSRFFNDNFVLTDVVRKNALKNLTDALVLSEAIDYLLVFVKQFSETINLSDTKTKSISITRSDVLHELDKVYKATGISFKDNIQLSSLLSKTPNKSLSDKLTLSESIDLLKLFVKLLSENISVSELLVKNYFTIKTDSFDITDLSVQADVPGKLLLVEALHMSALLNKNVDYTIEDYFELVENLEKGFNTTLNKFRTNFASIVSGTPFSQAQGRSNFDYILNNVPFSEEVTWTRYGNDESALGRSEDITTVFSGAVDLVIQPIKDKDRSLLPQGVQVTGYLKAYAKSEYVISGVAREFKVGDVLVRNDGKSYMVDNVQGKWRNDSVEIYKKLLLRRIDND